MDYSTEVRRRFAAAVPNWVDHSDGVVVVAEAEDRTLGLWVRCHMSVVDSTIASVAFEVFGCPDSIAASSLIAERLCGRSLKTLDQIDVRRVAVELSIPTEKLGKLLRMEDAVLACKAQVDAD